MAKGKKQGKHFHLHHEALEHAEQTGGTVKRDRIWVVYPSGRESSADTTEAPESSEPSES